jgi:glycosyltransferase involved in cell wall biosynthesis
MNILLLHNRYSHRGGEDSVFEAEYTLLREAGHRVRAMEFDNEGFSRGWRKLLGGLLSVFNPWSFLRVVREIRSERPDVLHVHNLFSTATPAVIWAAWIFRVPVVMTLHNFRLLCPSATLLHDGQVYEKSLRAFFPWDAVRKRAYRGSLAQTLALALTTTLHRVLGTWNRVSRFLVLSEFSRAKFLESRLGVPKAKFVVKPNFVADRGCSLEKSEEFLFVGRLSPEKGLPVLLRAFEGTDLKLAIVGDGPLRSEVEAAVAKAPNIRYLGLQPSHEVMELMRHAKALIFCSIWYETFGMVAIEAFSAGTPVLASRLGTMAELVLDGENGLHFQAGCAEELRQAAQRMQADQSLHARLCQGARSAWEKRYTPELNATMLLDAYSKFATGGNR